MSPDLSSHTPSDSICLEWPSMWNRYQASPSDHEFALTILLKALSAPELLPAQYAQALALATVLERSDTVQNDSNTLLDWPWVKDFLSSMAGEINLSASQISLTPRKALLNRSMRIGIDVRCLEVDSTRRRGIGRYVINTVRELARQGIQHRFILLGDHAPWDAGDVCGLLSARNVEYQTYSRRFASDLDAYLVTDPLPVLKGRELLPYPVDDLPIASIIYDLIPLAFPNHYLVSNEAMHRQYVRTLRELVGITSSYLPISEFVGEELKQRVGINPELVHPILGGLDEAFLQAPTSREASELLRKHRIDGDYFVYAGGFDYRKNLKTLLHGFIEYRKRNSTPCKLVLVGDFLEQWLAKQLTGTPDEHFLTDIICPGFVTDDELRCLYSRATAFVFPSLHEGFGLPALEAMACGCPVIVSHSTSLNEIVGDAGVLIDPLSASSIADAMTKLSANPAIADEYRKRGLLHSRKYTWSDVAAKTLDALGAIARPSKRMSAPSRKLRVLVQNRPDAFTARGGDTVVMDQLYRSLRDLDVDIDVACGTPDLNGVDIVHLINLTVRKTGMEVMRNAERQTTPLVVTTLLEDWPRYLDKSIETARVFQSYLINGQQDSFFHSGMKRVKDLASQAIVGNDEIVTYASALFVCGETEAQLVRSAYSGTEDKTRIAQFGITDMSRFASGSPEAIRKAIGTEEYILCCGRLETRKNQLMLLKAMEDSEMTIVLVGGGFSAQPEYVQLVKNFKRRGKVIIAPRLNIRELANAMAAASVHVLPSWYELPGLVTLEAASCSIPVVASDWGAITDYLPQSLIHTCRPDDPDSIRDAIHAALTQPVNPQLAETAKSFTAQRFGEQVLKVYEEMLSKKSAPIRESTASKTNIHFSQIEKTPPEENLMASTPYSFDVSIVIPVYNQAQLTRECLEAISTDSPRASYEVIIVDNHSTDETPKLLEAIEGDIKVLREPVNRGFAAACNRGARLADGKYLLFLNNDTAPRPGWLDAMVDCANQRQNLGAVGAKLVYPTGKTQHAGIAFNPEKTPFNLFQNFPEEHPAVNQQRTMQAVSAACMLVPEKLFSEMHGLDEAYQNGFEDVDFCLRLAQHGKEVVYCPEAEVVHYEESTEGRKDHDKENIELFLSRWSKSVMPDDHIYTAQFGLRLEWNETGGVYREVGTAAPANTQSSETDSSVLIDEASKRYVSGDYEGAVKVLQRVVESKMTLANEDGFEAWQTMGNCFARLNKAEEAEKAYLEAVRLNENSERPYLGLGSVAMLQQNWVAAQYGFMAALAKNPTTVRGEFGVGISLAARNKHEEAIGHFKSVLDAEPDNAEALFYLYRSAMESNDPMKALDQLEAYVLTHPSDTDFLYHFCGMLWKMGELTRAIEIGEQILEIDPHHAPAKEAIAHMRNTIAEHV